MRLLVLSRLRVLYSTRRFREAATGRGHEVRIHDPLECTLLLDRERPRLLHRSREIPVPDCAIPRVGSFQTAYSAAVVRHLEVMGVPVLNRADAVLRARDKLRSLQTLAERGIPVPRTAMARSPEAVERVLDRVGGPPVVLKLLHGTQGVGVILAETRAAVDATLDTLWGLGQDILIQEFVAESRGRDVRALVVDGEVVAAMRRQARPGEWRSNIHRGGVGEPVRLEPEYADAAVGAARAIGLDVAGVDLLEGAEGPRVMEINASPGFEGLERATGVDVAGRIVRLAEERAAATAPAPGRAV